MKQLLIVKPGTISAKDKEKLTKNGYIMIEHPFPSDVRVLNPLDVDGDLILASAMRAISYNGSESMKAGFFNALHNRLYPKVEPKVDKL